MFEGLNCRVLRILVGLEVFTGVGGAVGGVLLVAEPDGSLLRADSGALRGSPFDDWRLPGVLLAVLVGGGMLLAAECHLAQWRAARALSVFAGLGLVTFELVELEWLGFQPLELVFAVVGVVIALLGWLSGQPGNERITD